MNKFRQACLKSAGPLALALAAAAAPLATASAQIAAAQQQQPSPNGRIAFQSTQGGDGFINEIYTMDADGKNQVRLTYNEFDDTFPVWSPQGDRIAFISWRNDLGSDIYLMNPDGTGERPLRDAAHGGPFQTNDIKWSPDGRRIMFASGGKITVVEVLASDGSYSDAPAQNLSEAAPAYAHDNNATWSPDGSRLAFMSYGCGGCSPEVFVMNADGTGRAQVTNNDDTELSPTWTSDGRIAYESWRTFPTSTYVSNADGTGEQPLVGSMSEVLNPVWSPDGTRVLFRSGGPAAAPRPGLYVMNADGSGITFLTDEANGGHGLFWSPDGSTIVAHSKNNADTYDVISFSSTRTSHHATNLTKTRKADEYAWSWQRVQTP